MFNLRDRLKYNPEKDIILLVNSDNSIFVIGYRENPFYLYL